MNLASRLNRLTSTLTAKERAVALIRASKEGIQPDSAIRGTMPPEQRRELNKILNIAIAANGSLASVCLLISIQTEAIRFQLSRIALVEGAVEKLETSPSVKDAANGVAVTRGREVPLPVFLRKLAQDMRREALVELKLRWQELRTVEVVWQEISEQLDGEDPVDLENRRAAAAGRRELRGLAESLVARTGSLKLPEPRPETVDQMRRIFEVELDSLNRTED